LNFVSLIPEILNHMMHQQLINPSSIAVIGGSNNIHKPGGKLVKNLMDGNFKGPLYVVNQKEDLVQGIKSYRSISDLPNVDLAFLAIPAKQCIEAVKILSRTKNTCAFIVISAGFSEDGPDGVKLERELTEVVNSVKGSLIGPNCIGVINQSYNGVFTSPIPKLDSRGCDFISGSGATAVFIMESGIPKGLTFSSIYSVGNSAQIGVEEVLESLDESFNIETSSRVKLLYIESIRDPDKLLKHSSSLIRKGCRIAAIKSGGSAEGSRAASSHTGALTSSDLAVEALFRKAGIIRCYGREELITVACVLMHPEIHGKNIAIVTHAGGPAVMLTDALSNGGLKIPRIEGPIAEELQLHLNEGASVSNPIDLLATGTAVQLGLVIDYCENRFTNIDAIMVIFGSTGLAEVFDAYEMLHLKMQSSKKPIFPILPSILTANREVEFFLGKGHINFPDEVLLGKAVSLVQNTPKPADEKIFLEGVDIPRIRHLIEESDSGYTTAENIGAILDAAGIPRVRQGVAKTRKKTLDLANSIGYPVVMKVVGPLHKTDVKGVALHVNSDKHLTAEYERLIKIEGTDAILIQPMIAGIELFIGAKYEPSFGHLILVGLGGIFVEVLGDVSSGLAPLTFSEAYSMIRSIKSYRIIKGTRGQEGVNEKKLAEIIVRLSSLLRFATEIKELDLNPLIGRGDNIVVVDSRMRIQKRKDLH
jgi:acetate---CoA ligase (ADP-forming)